MKQFRHFGSFNAFLIIYLIKETYAYRGPCKELFNHDLLLRADAVYPQDFDEASFQQVSITQILGKAINNESANCLLMDFNENNCSATVIYNGFVLMSSMQSSVVEIHTYSANYYSHWVTQVRVSRTDPIFHVYAMTYVGVYKQQGETFVVETNINAKIIDRFNTHFAALIISDTRDSVAFATCAVSSRNNDYKFYTSGGWVTRYTENYNSVSYTNLTLGIVRNSRLKLGVPRE